MVIRSRLTLRLSPSSTEMLDAMSRTTGRTRNELVHDAVEQFITGPNAATANLNRIAQTLEFLQIAIDHVHKRDLEPVRDGIMLNVAKRMELFHGTR